MTDPHDTIITATCKRRYTNLSNSDKNTKRTKQNNYTEPYNHSNSEIVYTVVESNQIDKSVDSLPDVIKNNDEVKNNFKNLVLKDQIQL